MVVFEVGTGFLFQAWKVTMGPLPEFLQVIKEEGNLIISEDTDYQMIKPIPFLDDTHSTKVGIHHLDPQGFVTWDFANAGDIIVNKTHQYSDRADVEIFSPQKFNQRFRIIHHTI